MNMPAAQVYEVSMSAKTIIMVAYVYTYTECQDAFAAEVHGTADIAEARGDATCGTADIAAARGDAGKHGLLHAAGMCV